MTQIDELVIRIPGIHAQESKSLAEEIGQLVAAALPDTTRNHQIPELTIQVTPSQLNSPASLASSIAKQIIMQIKLAALYK